MIVIISHGYLSHMTLDITIAHMTLGALLSSSYVSCITHSLQPIMCKWHMAYSALGATRDEKQQWNFYSKALYSMVFGPKSLNV